MIEFRGDIHRLLRSVSEDTAIAVKRSAASSAPAPRSGAKQGPEKKPSRVARKSAHEGQSEDSLVINFEYRPLGEIRLNKKERQHIIDFFD